MSITFDDDRLFDTGPARVHVGGRALHHAIAHALSGAGVRLFSQGVDARAITQTGALVADTPAQLQAQLDAIEVKLDGLPHVLVDHLERAWPNVVMLKLEPGPFTRLGTRWKAEYRIAYVQVHS